MTPAALASFLARRAGKAVLVVLGVVVLNFLLIRLAPGDPALVIAGQLCVALMLDHFALIGLPGREVGALRIVGAGLLVAGALLITRN